MNADDKDVAALALVIAISGFAACLLLAVVR